MIPSARPHAVEPPTQFTRVDLTFIKDKIEQRIVFGRLADGHTIDKHRFIASFAAGSVFGVRRWAINAYGTTFARIDILRAAAVGEPISTVPFVRPGAEIFLTVHGAINVERVMRMIQSVRDADVDPVYAAPDYWAHVANRLAADEEPRPYSRARHLAWTLRQRLAL